MTTCEDFSISFSSMVEVNCPSSTTRQTAALFPLLRTSQSDLILSKKALPSGFPFEPETKFP